MILIAMSLEAFITVFHAPTDWVRRIILCISRVIVIGIASALYLTCYLGAGPRDGLMVGICQKTGWRVGVVRSSIEIIVCGIGWLFGGTLGVGTVLFAFGVSWVVQITLNFLAKFYPQS